MKPLLLSIALSFGADAATTHVGLESGRMQERVFPTQNPYVVDAIVAGETVFVSWALVRLSKDHPKLAKSLGWGLVGFRSGIAANNARLLK